MKIGLYLLSIIFLLFAGGIESTYAQESSSEPKVPTTVKVYTDGETTFSNNMVDLKAAAQVTLHAEVYDQNNEILPNRRINLYIITPSNSQPTLGKSTITSGGTDNTAFIPNGFIGRTTIEAVDEITGLKGYCYITTYNSDDNFAQSDKGKDASGNEQKHTVSTLVESELADGSSSILNTIGNETNLWTNKDGSNAAFTLDLGAYFNIGLVQIQFEKNNIPDNYVISFSKDNTTWPESYTYNKDGNSRGQDTWRIDAFNDRASYLTGYRYVKFSTSTLSKVTIKDFQLFGTYESATLVDDTKPTLEASVDESSISTDQGTKTSTVTLNLKGSDDLATTLTYIIKNADGLEYTTTGANNTEIQYTRDDYTPGTTHVLTIWASDGTNLSDPVEVTFSTLALDAAPEIRVTKKPDVSKNSATITYTITDEGTEEGTSEDLVVILTDHDGNKTFTNVTATKAEGALSYTYSGTLDITGLNEGADYIYTIRVYDGTLYSGFEDIKFTTLTDPLIVTFTDGKGEHPNIKGSTGKLKELINDCDDGEKDFTKVTSLRVESGLLNGADIATLRQMAQGNDYIVNNDIKHGTDAYKTTLEGTSFKNPDGWQQGQLSTLDLSNAGFKESDDIYLTDYLEKEGKYTATAHKTTTSSNLPDNAFANCQGLTSVVLPTTVIPEGAFYQNTNLQKVTVKGGANVTIVGNGAFEHCKNLTTIGNTEGTIDLSNVVNNDLGEYAFFNSDGITTVILSPNLTSIRGYTFEQCENLTTVNMDELKNLTLIGYDAFRDCHKFVLGKDGKYKVPDTVEEIGDWAFANIEVQEIEFPKNPKYTTIRHGLLGWNSKEGNEKYGLTTVNIPANVTTIVDQAFQDCQQLTGLKGTIDENAHITSIGGSAFANNTSMEDADLTRLLKDITVVNGSTFQGCTKLHKIDLRDATATGITTVYGAGFADCTNVTSIDLGDHINRLEDAAFGRNKAVTEITVHTAKAPTTPAELTTKDDKNNVAIHDPFESIPANQVTITFDGEANSFDKDDQTTGYMSYRANPAFLRLLTKHLDEDSTAYHVAGQMHADVILQRNFKAGYNTFAVPFGAKANSQDRPITGTNVFYNALFKGGSDQSKISVYRGLKNNETFMFLKYSRADNNDLDEFEPMMVFMTKNDIDNATVGADNQNVVATDYCDLTSLEDKKQYYRFENVDVNYDSEAKSGAGELYTSSTVPSFVDSNNQQFTGARNVKAGETWFSNTTDDYAFIGSYINSTETMHVGDYFIQTKGDGNSYFYVVENKTDKNGKPIKYRSKGFRGWFRPVNTGNGAKSLSVEFVEENGHSTTDGIKTVDIDDYNNTKPANVYNLNGQLVSKNATSLNGLPKGIYIWNGKKVIVK